MTLIKALYLSTILPYGLYAFLVLKCKTFQQGKSSAVLKERFASLSTRGMVLWLHHLAHLFLAVKSSYNNL